METSDRASRFRDLRTRFFKQENIKRSYFINQANSIIREIANIYMNRGSETIDASTVFSALSQRLTVRERDFIETNPSLVDAPLTTINLLKLEKTSVLTAQHLSVETMRFLAQILPEYFSIPPAVEPDYQMTKKSSSTTETTEQQLNLRDYIHIAQAYNTFIVEDINLEREARLEQKKSRTVKAFRKLLDALKRF